MVNHTFTIISTILVACGLSQSGIDAITADSYFYYICRTPLKAHPTTRVTMRFHEDRYGRFDPYLGNARVDFIFDYTGEDGTFYPAPLRVRDIRAWAIRAGPGFDLVGLGPNTTALETAFKEADVNGASCPPWTSSSFSRMRYDKYTNRLYTPVDSPEDYEVFFQLQIIDEGGLIPQVSKGNLYP